MKKITLVLSMCVLLCALVACGKTNDSVEVSENNTTLPDGITTTAPVEELSDDDMSQGQYIPEGSDFVYTDETMTEIIGITEQCKSSLALIFGENVTKISNVALSADSQITTIVFLNDNVELENVNFAGSNLTTIKNLPTSMKSIPANMFYGCTKLNTLGDEVGVITIPDHIVNIEPSAFGGCTKITKVIATNITDIGDKAFEGCKNLNEFVFSDNLVSIGTLSFYMCGFEKITFPESLETINENAFTLNTLLTTVDISDTTVVNATAFNKCDLLTTEINYSEVTESTEDFTETSEENVEESTNENVENN